MGWFRNNQYFRTDRGIRRLDGQPKNYVERIFTKKYRDYRRSEGEIRWFIFGK